MIRTATAEDADGMAEALYRAWQTAFIGILRDEYPKTIDKARYTRIFRDNITQAREDMFVYWDDQSGQSGVAGFVTGRLNGPDSAEVIGLYIHPARQGQGIGTRLFGHIAAFYRAKGVSRLDVRTLRGAANNAFYEKQGCRVVRGEPIAIGAFEYEGVVYRAGL